MREDQAADWWSLEMAKERKLGVAPVRPAKGKKRPAKTPSAPATPPRPVSIYDLEMGSVTVEPSIHLAAKYCGAYLSQVSAAVDRPVVVRGRYVLTSRHRGMVALAAAILPHCKLTAAYAMLSRALHRTRPVGGHYLVFRDGEDAVCPPGIRRASTGKWMTAVDAKLAHECANTEQEERK